MKMFVKSAMIPKHKCFVVQEGDSVEKALKVLEEHSIDGVPVLSDDKYLGVVTRHHIYKKYFHSNLDKDSFVKETKVEDIALYNEKLLVGDEIFEKTLLELKDFPILSVVNEDNLFMGIVTRYDIVAQFQSAFGMNQEGVRISFTSVETEGRIARLGDIIQQYHESVISLVTFDESDKLLRRIVMKIEKKDNIDKFIKKLEKSGFRVLHIQED